MLGLEPDDQLDRVAVLRERLVEHDADLQIPVKDGCTLVGRCGARDEAEMTAFAALHQHGIFFVFGHGSGEDGGTFGSAARLAFDDYAGNESL